MIVFLLRYVYIQDFYDLLQYNYEKSLNNKTSNYARELYMSDFSNLDWYYTDCLEIFIYVLLPHYKIGY